MCRQTKRETWGRREGGAGERKQRKKESGERGARRKESEERECEEGDRAALSRCVYAQ